jgi:hypothetical protein
MTEKTESNSERFMRLNKEENKYGEIALSYLYNIMQNDPDKVRALFGSVASRDIEIFVSLRKQVNAALEEWLHEKEPV